MENINEELTSEEDDQLIVAHMRPALHDIIRAGGIGNFKMSMLRANKARYIGSSPIGGAERNGLVLVCKISTIEEADDDRKFVRCTLFARVEEKDVWPEKTQFPVIYRSWAKVFKSGLRPDQLQWKTREEMMIELGISDTPEDAPASSNAQEVQGQGQSRHRLTLVTAKAILAAHLQTTPDAITIEI